MRSGVSCLEMHTQGVRTSTFLCVQFLRMLNVECRMWDLTLRTLIKASAEPTCCVGLVASRTRCMLKPYERRSAIMRRMSTTRHGILTPTGAAAAAAVSAKRIIGTGS